MRDEFAPRPAGRVSKATPASARILEIGDFHYVKDQYPGRTGRLWTGGRSPLLGRSQYFDAPPARFLRAMAELRAGRYDLVVAYMGLRSPWHPRNWLRALAAEPMRPFTAPSRVFGVSWLRFVSIPAPLVVLDMNDAFILGRHNFFLLDKADLVFKRELPVDRWHMLCHSLHPMLPTRRIRRQPRWQERLVKSRPHALPAPGSQPRSAEPAGLVRAVETGLGDKQQLERMALAAREHVLRYHTPRALVDHVIERGLASGCRPGVGDRWS